MAATHGPVFELIEARLQQDDDAAQPTTKVKTVLNGKGWLLYDLLSPKECRILIEATEQLGYDVKYSGERYCHRSVHHDPRLAEWLWRRVSPYCPSTYPLNIDQPAGITGEDESLKKKTWHVVGLNPSFRACKYLENHRFGRHIDYSNYVRKQKSWYTLMLYLNSPNNHDDTTDPSFEGGNTNFFDYNHPDDRTNIVVETVVPQAGMAILFVQDDATLPHEGALVTKGVKYMIRTDVLYERRTTLNDLTGL
eukprot:TRINITY_DN2132_c0_g1_i2.p1 TRINITY_DN2132_c0_g1~~TRINITY_DN2132_c0_g1_i2.p1  ORF type:complete len:251 (-),score=59.74 TRINITY_DN2132_c0_g1_i2:225-977(-)